MSRTGFIVPKDAARAAIKPVLGELSVAVKEKVLREASEGGLDLQSYSDAFFRRVLGASDVETELLVATLLPRALPTLAAGGERGR